MSGWSLDARLGADTVPVTSLPLCDVRLMDDARYPWLILVPRVTGAVDWTDLDRADQHQLADEIDLAGRALLAAFAPHKLNVATLGNVVAQLHVHVLGRDPGDPAWPRPVWGHGETERYGADALASRVTALRARFARPA